MGQPEDIHEDTTADRKEVIRHSYASQSSDDSFILSGSSKESCEGTNTSSSSLYPCDSTRHLGLSNHCNPNPHTRSTHASQSQCVLCEGWNKLSDQEKLLELINTALKKPDTIRWKEQTQTVKLERNAKGSLCFEYKDVKGEKSSKMYTLVKRVSRDGPAYGKIYVGDCILSANGQPLDSSQDITLRSVVSINKTKPVSLIIQHPEAIICHRKSSRKSRPLRSISQERQNDVSHPHGHLERMDSGKMSTNSSHDSKTPSEVITKSVDERLQGLIDSENLTCLDAHMPRLPCIRVLITGSEAGTLAKSLLGGVGNIETLGNDVGVCYRGSVKKTSSGFTMEASNADPKEWVTDLLESVANMKPVDLSDRVELEITAVNSHPFSTYCHHILATAHTIYIIQFCCQDFLENKQSVLLDIQRRLNKIRTYASNKVPVYLVMTVENSLPNEQLSGIGQSLHRQFAKAFTNQLQYNAATNFPCFPVVRTLSKEHVSHSSNCHSNRDFEECCIISKHSGRLDASYSVRSSETLSSTITPAGREFDVSKLQDHISQAAFEQKFISDRYPFCYLLHRERIQKLKKNGLHYVYKASIMQECTGITSEKDRSSLLRFLHNSGDILSADCLQYKDFNNTICFKTTSNNILLDRQYLITAAKRLTTIPNRAQQQDPGLPGSIQQWEDLQEKCTASSMFLEYLLGNEAANILTSLSLVNIIHLLHQPAPQSANTYLIPFFFPHGLSNYQQSSPFPSDPNLYELCVDFHGSIPDGFFMQVLVRLLERSWATHGRWSIDGPAVACLTLANDCEMTVIFDEMQSIIRILARYRVTYKGQDLLVLITKIVDDLKRFKSDLRVTVGPPCPLPPHLCKAQAREPGKTHVIDIAGGRAPGPLWCGDRQIDLHPRVTHWMIQPADIMKVSLGPRHERTQVSLRTHIKDLPPKLFNWLCNHLNVPPVGRDWQGLANVLGYTICDVRVFEVQKSSVFDPCRSLLLDWAQYASATFGALIEILDKDLERRDILTDMQEKWHIVK